MYDICVLVCRNGEVRHFNIVKCADLLLERSILVAERTLTHFGRVVSNEVNENIRHYRLLNKSDDHYIESLDGYICARWVGDTEHRFPQSVDPQVRYSRDHLCWWGRTAHHG